MDKFVFSQIRVVSESEMMIRAFIGILGFLIMIPDRLTAQPYIIQGSIEHSGQGMIYLASFYGDRFRIADSIETSTGSFLFLLSDEFPPGVCRLIFSDEYGGIRSENRFVEFIYNREDISMGISINENGPIPVFENSTENRVYFEFMTFQLEYEEMLTRVYNQLFPARPGGDRYDSTVKRYEELQHGRNSFMDSLTLLYPGLYATRIMNAFRAPVVRGSMTHPERIDTLKLHFFDVASIDDPDLLYAPVYTYRIVDYLSLYSVDTFSMEHQEAKFVEAVDQIMMNVSPLPELRSFVVEFMLEGFELLGMEQVLIHLADQYLDESCESEVAELVRTRMEGYKKMAAGATAPDFTVRDTDGKSRILSEIPNPYTLVVFWTSTCGHCRELIPELKQWYMEENTIDMEVVAISIDSSTALFEQYIAQEPMPWITVHDPAGWQGRVASLYQIYATPTLFLVNRERTILARPASFRQLQKTLKKLN